MAKKTAKPISDLQVQIVLEHVKDQYRMLKEGEDAVKDQLRTEMAAGFERVNDQLLFIRLRVDSLEKSQAAMQVDVSSLKTDVSSVKADASDLKAGQARIEARLDHVVASVTRHDAEIIKLWATHRTPPPRKARTARG